MSYAVKEIFYSLQGEGARAGRAAVFCRFAGCNLWSGREADRDQAVCRFCDTDIVGTGGMNGGRYCSAEDLATAVGRLWPSHAGGSPYVILTGGEPLLQVDNQSVAALHDCGFEVGVETNGTIGLPTGIDWICVSPKANSDLLVTAGDELKWSIHRPASTPRSSWTYPSPIFSFSLLTAPSGQQAWKRRCGIAWTIHAGVFRSRYTNS